MWQSPYPHHSLVSSLPTTSIPWRLFRQSFLSSSPSSEIFNRGNICIAKIRNCNAHLLIDSFSLMAIGDPTLGASNLSLDSNEVVENEQQDEKQTAEDGFDNDNVKADDNAFNEQQMVRVCDKLIDIFMVDKPHPTDWRRLLAFSTEWINIRAHFYRRCHERAESENEPTMKQALHRLCRKIKEVDDDVQRHNELLAAVKEVSIDVSGLIAKRRKDFTGEFFEHLHAVAESYHDSPSKQKELLELRSICLAAVQAYDSTSESIEALNAAELKFEDIINSPTINEACQKIDNLAEKKQLDSALMLMLTKAWSAAKDSNVTKNEVKDILYHLYMTARKNLETQVPKETRILRYLLTIEDPEELMAVLADAFTPGDGELNSDSLSTTPHALFTWIQTVVDAINFSRQGTLINDAKDLVNPQMIHRLEKLKSLIKDKFM